MNYIFGPVPSRRLGCSLGIDTIPLKTCNWNCIYCQLGRTRPVIHKRAEYVPSANIQAELHQKLATQPPGTIDWINVFEDAVSSIIQKPVGTRTTIESQNDRDSEESQKCWWISSQG